MTPDEKQRMFVLVRAIELLYAETISLKTVLFAHHIPDSVWEPESTELINNPKHVALVRAKFQHLYDEIARSPDLSKVLESLALSLPISEKPD
jgi:hypothetical protein